MADFKKSGSLIGRIIFRNPKLVPHLTNVRKNYSSKLLFLDSSKGGQTNDGGKGSEDNEILHQSSERFRMKLIRDFRLLENITEMEAGLEAPKYHAQVSGSISLLEIKVEALEL